MIWQVLTGISGLGLLCSLPMKGLPLHTQVDEKWGMDGKEQGQNGGAVREGEGEPKNVGNGTDGGLQGRGEGEVVDA